jgi:hypothetical protein
MSLYYTESSSSEHPDIEGQESFKKKAERILAARKKARATREFNNRPNVKRAVNFFSKSEIRKQQNESYDDSGFRQHSTSINSSSSSDDSRPSSTSSFMRKMREMGMNVDVPKKKKKKKKKLEEAAPLLATLGKAALSGGKAAGIRGAIGSAGKEYGKAKLRDVVSNSLNKSEEPRSDNSTSTSTEKIGRGDTTTSAVKKAISSIVGEETMTSRDKSREASLKKKYDDSEMKQNMIDQYGKERGTQIYFAKIRKMAMKEETHTKQTKEEKRRQALLKKLERMIAASKMPKHMSDVAKEDFDYLEEKKLSRTARRSARIGKPGYDEQGRRKPKGKVRAWDMDETLFRNDPKKIRVHVKDKSSGKTTRSLTNQEFNTDKLNKDKEEYDFNEFRSSQKFKEASKPNKSMVKKLKKQVRRGKPVHIVTARGSFDDQPKFAGHLRKHGIEIDKGKGKGGRHVHVHRAGDMPGDDIGKKKVSIVKGLMKKHGTSGGEMYDDAAKVQRAFKKSNKETPTSQKVKTKMVQPNKKNVTQARSFKEEIDLELVYNFLLEQLVLEEIAEDHEDAIEIIENLDDELLEELVMEGYEFIETVLEETLDETYETPKIKYVSPYKKLQEKKEIFETYSNVEKVTPYEYWKSFIGYENEEEFSVNEDVEDDYEEFEPNGEMTSYEYWKKRIEEAVGRDAMIAANIARAKSAKQNKLNTPTTSAGPTTTSVATKASSPSVVPSSIANTPSPVRPAKAQTGFAGLKPTTPVKR